MRVSVSRNLEKYNFTGSISKDDRILLEQDLKKSFSQLITKFKGRYVSLTPGHNNYIDQDEYHKLLRDKIIFNDMSDNTFLSTAGIANDWPFGRGCYISGDNNIMVWLGQEDHLKIIVKLKGKVFNELFDKLKDVVDIIQKEFEGEWGNSEDFGILTSCPVNSGTGMKLSVHYSLPKLTKDGIEKIKDLALGHQLYVCSALGEGKNIESGNVYLSPLKKL